MTISTSTDSRVRTITLDDPARRNAWNAAMEVAFRAAIAAAVADDAIRAIVVTGAGDAFCAGADLSGATTTAPPPPPSPDDAAQRYGYLLGLPKPLVAAINGAAAGVGLCLALYCDMRFLSSRVRLTTAFARRGLVAEHGIVWMLSRLIGEMHARDLLLSGRTIDATEAAAMGLGRLVPEDRFAATVMDYAQELAERSSPRSIAVIKRQLLAATRQTLAEATQYGDDEMALARGTEDQREGIAHFLEKRPPVFSDR